MTQIKPPPKKSGRFTFRHSFTTYLLQFGRDIRNLQELLDHSDMKTIEIIPMYSTKVVLLCVARWIFSGGVRHF